MEEQEVIVCLYWREIDGNEKSIRRYFKTTQRTNIHLCSFQLKLSVYQYFYSVCLLFWWFDLNDLEEKGEQKHVGNNWSSLMKTCIASESTPSSRVCVFGIMRVLCWDYEKGKVMSACVCDELIEFIWRCTRMKECVEDVVVRNWDGMERIWNDTFITKLCVVVEEHLVLHWYSLTSKQNPEMTGMMFESFVVFELIVSTMWTQNRNWHCHQLWWLSQYVCKMTVMFFLTVFQILIVGRNELDGVVIKLMNENV